MNSPTILQILLLFYFVFNYVLSTKAHIFISCGASGNSTGLDGREWISDSTFVSRVFALNKTSIVSESVNLPSSVDPVPYMTSRIFRSSFTYTFRIDPGKKFLRLHFHPSNYPEFENSSAFFSVSAGPFTLLTNFSPSITADSLGRLTVVKEFCLNIEQNHVLNLTFSPSSTTLGAYAFINGIEIVSMPKILFSSFEKHAVLETIHRLNIGGNLISPAKDSTGLYRGWFEDKKYFRGSGDKRMNATVRIMYTETTPYVAPDEVYQTARYANKQNRLSWNLPVDSGFTYLVRLHFCELQPEVMKRGSRKFVAVIGNGKSKIEDYVISWSGGSGIAVYKDYVIKMPSMGNSGRTELVISLGCDTKLRSVNCDPILNGLEVFKLSDSRGNLTGLNPASKSQGRKLSLIIAGAISGFFTVVFLSGLVIFCILRKGKDNTKKKTLVPKGLCRHFKLDELRAATNNFDRERVIGNGGFGSVFKGCIDGDTCVAIKALKAMSKQGSTEFEAEIRMLSELRHPNLVSLIGYCDEMAAKIIVYDYVPRGTLRDHLYEREDALLSWKQRLEICIGVASALKYLHSQNPKVIHRDIKPSNILLDENLVAKVSDFGLSRFGPTSLSRSHVTTGVKGTFGYMDPDYFQTNHLSVKSDVYSFGVVLFEILCARPAVDLRLDYEQQSLAEWVQHRIRAGKLGRIIDPNLKGEISPKCLKRFASIALKCLNEDRHKRPTMSDVLKRLEHALELQHQFNIEAVSDEEIANSNDMEIALRPGNNSKVTHSCPVWNKKVSHKELFRFLSDKAGFKWAKPPSLCGLQTLCCAVPSYRALSRDGHMSNSSDCELYGTPGRVMVPILFDDDDTFKL